MAMKVLLARWAPTGPNTITVRVQVHLDTTKTTTDALGATIPDPVYVVEKVWQVPAQQPTETGPQLAARLQTWMAATKPEFKAECVAALAALTTAAGTLSIEGQAL